MNKESKLNLNAGDYAISHCDSDKTYNGLEVHKMLCDAYIAGSNDTLEDDDERIKNSLINLIKMSSEVGGLALHKWEADEMLAWLEKQGEQIDIANKEYWRGYREGKKEILDKYAEQSKQKPADSYCKENCKGYQETGKCFADGGCKAKKEAEQKPEENKGNIGGISPNWNEEDEKNLRRAIRATKVVYPVAADWLRSLQDRVQPQNKWKPSDEQMGCLSDAIEHYNSLGYPAPKLKELLDDLKKLKEGKV